MSEFHNQNDLYLQFGTSTKQPPSPSSTMSERMISMLLEENSIKRRERAVIACASMANAENKLAAILKNQEKNCLQNSSNNFPCLSNYAQAIEQKNSIASLPQLDKMVDESMSSSHVSHERLTNRSEWQFGALNAPGDTQDLARALLSSRRLLASQMNGSIPCLFPLARKERRFDTPVMGFLRQAEGVEMIQRVNRSADQARAINAMQTLLEMERRRISPLHEQDQSLAKLRPSYSMESPIGSFSLDNEMCSRSNGEEKAFPAGLYKSSANNPSMQDTEYLVEKLLEGSKLVSVKLRGHASDSLIVAFGHMKPCRLTVKDQVGKYKHRKLNSIGICCKHCGGSPGCGRYFPSTFESFVNGTNPEKILAHIGQGCQACPPEIQKAVQELELRETMEPTKLRYGSRKRFFHYFWKRFQRIGKQLPEVSD